MTAIDASSAEHYEWGDRCDGWHLVRSDDLSVIEERMPPGTSEEPHAHERAHQFFFVLDGTMTMRLAGESVRLDARHGIDVPAGVAHQAVNESGQDVRFIVVSSPKSRGDRIPAEVSGPA